MIGTMILYAVAIICGALTKELIHFNKNQAYYSRGVNTISGQIGRYLFKRWDNLAVALPLGVLFTLVFHNTVNSEAVTALLLEKVGVEGVSLNLSGYALVAIFSAFSEWIGRKIGLIKEDKLED
jgi:hypothetical protein